MPVTLEQARLNVQDDLQQGVIDEFRKSSFLMENLTFHDCVHPTAGNGDGGPTLSHSYTRLKTQPTADFRAINSEYTAHEVEKEKITVDLAQFGGAFNIDRVIADLGGITDECELQMKQKIKATTALFNDTVINGDTAIDSDAFDGLDKALTGSSTEFVPGSAIDLSTSAAVTDNFQEFIDMLDEFLMGLDGAPSFIGGNTKLIAKIRACARRASMYSTTKDDFGRQVEMYGIYPLIDFGAKSGTNNPVVAIDGTSGETPLYAARLAMDGLHAISLADSAPVKTWLPDFSTAGAVKTGEVEMIAAVALKKTKSAGVMRKIKVQ